MKRGTGVLQGFLAGGGLGGFFCCCLGAGRGAAGRSTVSFGSLSVHLGSLGWDRDGSSPIFSFSSGSPTGMKVGLRCIDDGTCIDHGACVDERGSRAGDVWEWLAEEPWLRDDLSVHFLFPVPGGHTGCLLEQGWALVEIRLFRHPVEYLIQGCLV